MKNTTRNLLVLSIVFALFVAVFAFSASAAGNVAVTSSEFETHQGETFTTTIGIPDNADIVSFELTLKYNSDLLTLVSAEENEDIKGALVFNTEDKPGEIAINYTRTNKNVNSYMPILDLTFTVDENIGIGEYECLSVSTEHPYIAYHLNDDGTLKKVDFSCDFAKLQIYEMGDVDLSGSVDIGDATIIRRHLAAFEGSILTGFKLSLADTFYDTTVDIADAVCLQRHLARLDVLYGNRVNVFFLDKDGNRYAAKSVMYDGTLNSIPAVPDAEGFSDGVWSLSADSYEEPTFTHMTKDLTLYAYYTNEPDTQAMRYYKNLLTDQYYSESGDLAHNLSSDLNLWSEAYYQNGYHASLIWSSSSNYILNSTTGHFTKPTYPQDLTLTAKIISYDNKDMIESEGTISFDYNVPGEFPVIPTKADVEDFLKFYFTYDVGDDDDPSNDIYQVNYDVKLISKLNNTVLPVEGAMYDNFEVRLKWYQIVDGEMVPISQIKRTTAPQVNDYVAVATFNGKPLDGDGEILLEDVHVTPIEQIEIKNYIINQIAAKQGTLATNGTQLWNDDKEYHTTVTWETGNANIAYVANNVIQLKDDAISGTTLPLNARVSYTVGDDTDEFILSYNLTVSSNNTIIKAPENMDPELYRAIKSELEENLGYRGDLTSAALANVKFVNLDLSGYPEITSLRGLSYCKNLRTLNISGLHITDGTMNQIATLSYLEAFIARSCGLDNLTDGGMATLRNAVNLKMIDLTDNNFTSLDSVFAEGIRYGNLREVYLSKNRLTDINALQRAPMMSYLSLSDNGLTTAGTACLANYPYLQYLSLAHNQIDSVDNLTGLKYLKELRLQDNNLSNVRPLRTLVNLEILYLGHNQIQSVDFFNSLTALQVLYVNDNQIRDISALSTLNKLELINVSNNQITSLSVLRNYKDTLTEIYAENNKITDFSFINGASKLRILMLSGNETEMAQDNMTTWLSALPEMQVLTLSDIRLNDLSFLSVMDKLVRLDVANCGLGAFSGDVSNIAMIADRYANLRVLDISNNDMRGAENELLKLKNATLLTVLYADNVCDALDAYTLTYAMSELKYISLENCGINSLNWLYKYSDLVYVDLAGNKFSDVDLESQVSNASQKTLKELYLDTVVPCSFTNAYRLPDFNVEKLSLAGVSLGGMENMPYLDYIRYLNLSNTGLPNLTGSDEELESLYSAERYQTVNTVDVSGHDAEIQTLEKLPNLQTVYAVGVPSSHLFYRDNLHTLQRLYNKGVTCYLYDKQTEYAPVAAKEGAEILNLIPDFSCDVTVAADNVISDNNPFIIDTINDYPITWTVSNSTNYEIADNHLRVKDYTGIEDEALTVTASITVYPDQAPVTRSFTINTTILRATPAYCAIDATGYSDHLTRDTAFKYDLTLKAAETEGFSAPVKPVEDVIEYSYSTTDQVPYPNILVVNDNHQFAVAHAAPLDSTVTISISISHFDPAGNTVVDMEPIRIPVTVVSRTFTATFVLNGGSLLDQNGLPVETRELVEDSLIFNGMTLSRPGYVFRGWYTDAEFQNLFSAEGTNAVMPMEPITLYAKWEALSYNLIFDANEGQCDTASKTVLSDVEVGALPTPTREYHTFNGWFLKDGTQVTESSKFARTEDLTVYAHWTLNSFMVTFDANGGSVSVENVRAYCGEGIGDLPTPTRDYYTFIGWFTDVTDGEEVTAETSYQDAVDRTIYAHWRLNDLSGWVKVSEVPSNAQVINNKWSYTQKTTTESRNTSLEGFIRTGKRWVQSGSGSVNWANFPGGFDTGNWYYQNFHHGNPGYGSYENETSKRNASNSWSGYIYWHWMYDCGGANGTPYRAIYHQYGYGPDNGFLYKYFGAFTSSNGNYSSDTGYCNSQGIRNYIIPERTANGECQGATRWFRFDWYTASYTDYYAMFSYEKTENLESTTAVSNGTTTSNGYTYTITNTQQWVQYRPI